MSIVVGRLNFISFFGLEEFSRLVLDFFATLWSAWLCPRLTIVMSRWILVAHSLILLIFFDSLPLSFVRLYVVFDLIVVGIIFTFVHHICELLMLSFVANEIFSFARLFLCFWCTHLTAFKGTFTIYCVCNPCCLVESRCFSLSKFTLR